MGYGGYSFEAHRAITSARADLPAQAVFKQRECHPLMRPHGLRVRESRDSESHPHSLGIILALDVTGSMGEIPELLAKKELPGFVKLLLDHGVPDPQVLFMAVGDAYGAKEWREGSGPDEAAFRTERIERRICRAGVPESGEKRPPLAAALTR